MIEVKLRESNNKEKDLSDKVTATVEIDEQLDSSLDSGTIRYLSTEPNAKGLNEPLAGYSVAVGDNRFDFVGMDNRALFRLRGVKVVKQTSNIVTVSAPEGRYDHEAHGTIDVSGSEAVEIIRVSGSIPWRPNAEYSDGKIFWSVSWTDRNDRQNQSYTVTIEYEVNSIYSHEVALTESSKLLQGVLIDGFGSTRPENITYQRFTNTVTDQEEIESSEVESNYMHRSTGSVVVPEVVDGVIGVEGKIGGGKIEWDKISAYKTGTNTIGWFAEWDDYTPSYSVPLVVTITYTYIRPTAETLKEVVDRLLAVTPFDGPLFNLTSDNAVLKVLDSVVAPEFRWNTQTTLWECLLQVGAVIDAMPVLVADADGNYTIVTFEFVNATVKEATSIGDEATNALGENVNETQYNSALSAVVENLRESG